MNTPGQKGNDERGHVDRLVDGELSDAERRALLARLDREPDGWRRCALAFLEAQCWREALDPLAARSGSTVRPSAVGKAAARPRTPGRARGLFSRAAVLLAAFALGWAVRGAPPAGPNGRGAVAARHSPARPETQRPEVPAPTVTREALVRDEEPPDPGPVTEPVLTAWERRGYLVERDRRLMSMELNDGRRVAVPVSEVRLRYVGDRMY
jgi:hypothetical protein